MSPITSCSRATRWYIWTSSTNRRGVPGWPWTTLEARKRSPGRRRTVLQVLPRVPPAVHPRWTLAGLARGRGKHPLLQHHFENELVRSGLPTSLAEALLGKSRPAVLAPPLPPTPLPPAWSWLRGTSHGAFVSWCGPWLADSPGAIGKKGPDFIEEWGRYASAIAGDGPAVSVLRVAAGRGVAGGGRRGGPRGAVAFSSRGLA